MGVYFYNLMDSPPPPKKNRKQPGIEILYVSWEFLGEKEQIILKEGKLFYE